jgi:hypothetical protein
MPPIRVEEGGRPVVLRFSLLVLTLQLALLGTALGCQSTPAPVQSGNGSLASGDTAGPSPAPPRDSDSGMLLRTGAIQLGPGVGRNLWRWQGDGEGGF